MRAAGRWHYAGQPVLYLTESAAAALLEVCVHTAANDVPPDFTLLRIEGPELKASSIGPDELPSGWQTQLAITRDRGTNWLREGKTALLRVPSAIVPHTANMLLNPLHRDAKRLRIVEALTYPFDPRIKS